MLYFDVSAIQALLVTLSLSGEKKKTDNKAYCYLFVMIRWLIQRYSIKKSPIDKK